MLKLLRRLTNHQGFPDGSTLSSASRESLYYTQGSRRAEILFTPFEGADFTFYLQPDQLGWKSLSGEATEPRFTSSEIHEVSAKL